MNENEQPDEYSMRIEDFPDEFPLCECDLEPTEDEMAMNKCAACGKLLS